MISPSVDSVNAGKRHALKLNSLNYIKTELLQWGTTEPPQPVHAHTRAQSQSVSPSTSIFCQTTPLFSKECTLEHPHWLVNIHLVHLTRMAVLFLSNQSEGPWKTASPFHRQHLCLHCSSGVCGTQGVIPGTGIPRKWALWSVPVSMVPPYQREVLSGPGAFVKSLWKDGSVSWRPRPDEGRIPLWFWGCAAQWMEEKLGEKTQKQHVWFLAYGQVGARGVGHSRGSQEGSNQASVYTFIPANTFSWKDTDRHKQTSVQTQTLSEMQTFSILSHL